MGKSELKKIDDSTWETTILRFGIRCHVYIFVKERVFWRTLSVACESNPKLARQSWNYKKWEFKTVKDAVVQYVKDLHSYYNAT